MLQDNHRSNRANLVLTGNLLTWCSNFLPKIKCNFKNISSKRTFSYLKSTFNEMKKLLYNLILMSIKVLLGL